MKPVAWESSTMSKASYFAASAVISSSFATKPSMENTPSVAISRVRQSCVSLSACSRAAMSEFGKRWRCALHNRMPSMMEAWLSASEITASSGPSRVSNSPPLASKQEV